MRYTPFSEMVSVFYYKYGDKGGDDEGWSISGIFSVFWKSLYKCSRTSTMVSLPC